MTGCAGLNLFSSCNECQYRADIMSRCGKTVTDIVKPERFNFDGNTYCNVKITSGEVGLYKMVYGKPIDLMSWKELLERGIRQ